MPIYTPKNQVSKPSFSVFSTTLDVAYISQYPRAIQKVFSYVILKNRGTEWLYFLVFTVVLIWISSMTVKAQLLLPLKLICENHNPWYLRV